MDAIIVKLQQYAKLVDYFDYLFIDKIPMYGHWLVKINNLKQDDISICQELDKMNTDIFKTLNEMQQLRNKLI